MQPTLSLDRGGGASRLCGRSNAGREVPLLQDTCLGFDRSARVDALVDINLLQRLTGAIEFAVDTEPTALVREPDRGCVRRNGTDHGFVSGSRSTVHQQKGTWAGAAHHTNFVIGANGLACRRLGRLHSVGRVSGTNDNGHDEEQTTDEQKVVLEREGMKESNGLLLPIHLCEVHRLYRFPLCKPSWYTR